MNFFCGIILFFTFVLIPSSETANSPDYENPPVLQASEILPPDLPRSPVHRVREEVSTAGYHYHFIMESNFGLYDIESLDLLKIRVHEVKTLANVIEKNRTDEFFDSLGDHLFQTVSTPVQILQDPGGTLSALGQGIGQHIQRIGRRFKDRNSSAQEDPGLRAKLISDEKRKAASELHLDVYSTNPKVQEFLDQIATARTRGDLVFKLGAFAIPGAAGLAVSAISYSNKVEDQLREKSPVDLYIDNEKKLLEMGMDSYWTGRFLNHPDLSPRHKTMITAALEAMPGVAGKEVLLEAALDTEGQESMAWFQVNRIVLLSRCHINDMKLRQITMIQGLPIAASEQGRNILLLPIDIAYASEDAEAILQGLTRERSGGWDLLLTGQLTPRARQKAESAGFRVVEGYGEAKN
ncbi:MAG: hypothetical protein ACE15F_23265 [bacterium]